MSGKFGAKVSEWVFLHLPLFVTHILLCYFTIIPNGDARYMVCPSVWDNQLLATDDAYRETLLSLFGKTSNTS